MSVVEECLRRRRYDLAGRSLQRALRSYLIADCEYYDCLPARQRSIAALADALLAAGVLMPLGHEWMLEVEAVGAKSAACEFVAVEQFGLAIGTLEAFLDVCPYIISGKGVRA